MSKDKKVTPIKYKQLDNDPEIKEVTNEMEKFFFGEQGIGLLASLGLSPGKTQKFLDDDFERVFEEVTTKHRDYIIKERMIRATDAMSEHIENAKKNGDTMMVDLYEEEAKKAEVEIIKELMEKEGY